MEAFNGDSCRLWRVTRGPAQNTGANCMYKGHVQGNGSLPGSLLAALEDIWFRPRRKCL